jgi:formate hydrogenlyase subunit 4
MNLISITNSVLAVLLAPLMFGIINRTKAIFAGRTGQPLLQTYYDISKLFKKGAVYSSTTTWVFLAGPLVGFAAVIAATVFIPFGGLPALFAFKGDFVVLAYFLGLARFMTVLSALDTGSSFEGMGASREVTFSALAEPAFLIGLAAVAKYTGHISLSPMLTGIDSVSWGHAAPALALISLAFFVVLLSENCRIPVDDPNTHLELTMIHEVMVLDHSGPDFAFILYGATLKLWLLGSILIGIIVPVHSGILLLDIVSSLLGMLALAVVIGIIESIMARLRLLHVPQLLLGATALSILSLVLVSR